ncbi:YggT family protein [Aggregatilineales bacterium SYSU G02658]
MLGMLLLLLIQGYILILFARSILSFFPNVNRRQPIVKLIHDVTEPVLKPIRERVGVQNGIDFSPIIVFIGLYVLMMIVQRVF